MDFFHFIEKTQTTSAIVGYLLHLSTMLFTTTGFEQPRILEIRMWILQLEIVTHEKSVSVM